MNRNLFPIVALATCALVLPACGGSSSSGSANRGYAVTSLVSDGTLAAVTVDANLVNCWGIAASPTGPFIVADNGPGVATSYDGNGVTQSLVITIPPPLASTATATPSGEVFNANAGLFLGDTFIFATEDGTISGWQSGSAAALRVDNSLSGAVYKGIALATTNTSTFIYVTNFNAGVVEVYNSAYAAQGTFTDPTVPTGYAPFGIANIEGDLVVTFALQDGQKHDDVAGAGNGFVDVFDAGGNMLNRFASQGALDSPWAVVLAPADFGAASGTALIGNFGDGRINAFDPASGTFLGTLSTAAGAPIVIDGLWGLSFGNDAGAGAHNTLFFTSGPNGEADGLLGKITATP